MTPQRFPPFRAPSNLVMSPPPRIAPRYNPPSIIRSFAIPPRPGASPPQPVGPPAPTPPAPHVKEEENTNQRRCVVGNHLVDRSNGRDFFRCDHFACNQHIKQ